MCYIDTVTLTHNEICSGVNLKNKHIFAIVLVDGDNTEGPYYIQNYFKKEPDGGLESGNNKLKERLNHAVKPEATI